MWHSWERSITIALFWTKSKSVTYITYTRTSSLQPPFKMLASKACLHCSNRLVSKKVWKSPIWFWQNLEICTAQGRERLLHRPQLNLAAMFKSLKCTTKSPLCNLVIMAKLCQDDKTYILMTIRWQDIYWWRQYDKTYILMMTRWQDLHFDDDKMTRLIFDDDKMMSCTLLTTRWQDLYLDDDKMTRLISWWRQDDKTYILMMIRWQDLYFDTIAIDEDEMLKRPRP